MWRKDKLILQYSYVDTASYAGRRGVGSSGRGGGGMAVVLNALR